jgi:hypothetical protein
MRTHTFRSARVATACVAIAAACMFAAPVPASATGTLTVSPTTLVFAQHPVVGAACPGAGCTYAFVTIHNGTSRVKKLSFATAPSPFWPTYGGTCNVTYGYAIPAHASCTFQFGFKPSKKNTHSTGKAGLHFTNGTVLAVTLVGTSHA